MKKIVNSKSQETEQAEKIKKGICPKCGQQITYVEERTEYSSDLYKFNPEINEWENIRESAWPEVYYKPLNYICDSCGYNADCDKVGRIVNVNNDEGE